MDAKRLGDHPNIARVYHYFVDSVPTPRPRGTVLLYSACFIPGTLNFFI
jgi:hypothetical protein